MKMHKRLSIAFAAFLLANEAKAEFFALRTYAASGMVTGTPFSIERPAGPTYSDHLVTHPTRPFFHRGYMRLIFDDPVTVVSKKARDEGKIQLGHGRQISNMLMAGGVGIGAKDITDELSGVVFKS